tara:strand:- start:33 stop:338 length:306 start_codon:yes stop_codon:yes gene_type:complete
LPDEEALGLTSVVRIFPDTWNNISWVIVNAVTLLIEQIVDQRKKIEQGKMYNSKNNQSIFYNMQEMLKLAASDRDKLLAEMAKMDKNAKMEMENVRLETTD